MSVPRSQDVKISTKSSNLESQENYGPVIRRSTIELGAIKIIEESSSPKLQSSAKLMPQDEDVEPDIGVGSGLSAATPITPNPNAEPVRGGI